MGAKPSAFQFEFSQSLSEFRQVTVYLISPSHVYNYYQEFLLKPNRYVFYDVRVKSEFLRLSISRAFWSWEGNKGPTDEVNPRPSTLKRKRGAQNNINKGPPPGQPTNDSPEFNQEYYELLERETKGKTVVVFTDNKHPNHLPTFLQQLVKSGSKARLICVLRGGLERLLNLRYRVILSNSNLLVNGPVEILSPRRLKDGCPALFVTGVDIFPNQSALVAHFRVTAFINLSSISLKTVQGASLDVFSAKFGVPDLLKVASCIQGHIKRRRVVLVVDDYRGSQYAVSACVAYLVLEGIPISQAIQFVKEKKPSADMNHLMTVHSDIPHLTPLKGAMSKIFEKKSVSAVWIPPKLLELGDEEDAQIVEEIIEKYVPQKRLNINTASTSNQHLEETPDREEVTEGVEYIVEKSKEENPSPEYKTSKPPVRYEVKQTLTLPRSLRDGISSNNSHDERETLNEKDENDKQQISVFINSPPGGIPSNKPSISSGSNYPSNKPSISSGSNYPSNEPSISSGSNYPSNEPSISSRSNYPSNEPSITNGSTRLTPVENEASSENPEYYEVIEVDDTMDVECGVVYQAEDGTEYYYEEVVEDEVMTLEDTYRTDGAVSALPGDPSDAPSAFLHHTEPHSSPSLVNVSYEDVGVSALAGNRSVEVANLEGMEQLAFEDAYTPQYVR